MNKKIIITFIILVFLAIFPATAEDGDWFTWRGPNGNGIYNSTAWSPAALGGNPKISWAADVKIGFSSVSVLDGRLYTMGNANKKDIISCLDAGSGKQIWQYSYSCPVRDYPGPRATPVIDGGNVYTLSGEGHVFCLNAKNGKVVWKKDLVKNFGARAPTWGFAGTPVVAGDLLLFNAGKQGLALHKKDGNKVWFGGKGTGGYAAPVVYTLAKKKYVAIFGEKAIYGVELETGKKAWEYPWVTSFDVNAADPVVVGSSVFFSSGYGKGCALLDISGKKPKLIWKNTDMASHFSSFIYKDGYLYGSDGNVNDGTTGLRCLEWKTGKTQWSQRLRAGSLIASNDYLIYFSEKGKLSIAGLDPDKYQEVASAQVLSGICWTPPVLVRDKLYLRNNRGQLVCIDLAGKK